MRVVCTADVTASGHYRIREPARVLRSQGLDVRIVGREGLPLIIDRAGRFRGIAADVYSLLPDQNFQADVVVLQRPMLWVMPDVIDWLQSRGTAVVVEVDDDFHSILPQQSGFGEVDEQTSPLSNKSVLMECMRKADLVTVSTNALADRYGASGKAVVLRNYVSEAWLDVPHVDAWTRERDPLLVDRPVRVGWAGSTRNHPTDLQVTHGGVGEACRRTGADFVCIGGGDSLAANEAIATALELLHVPVQSTPWSPLADEDGTLSVYPYMVAKVDVGIVPLAPVKFNFAKSWLKGMEYAALGIPFVASDLPEYRLLRQDFGVGVLVPDRRRSWERQVTRLVEDGRWRVECGAAGRVTLRDSVIERQAWRWQEAWAEALARRRGVKSAV